jgi:hypothetical protein
MITREEAIERVELYLRRQGFEVATRQLTEEIVEAIGEWEEEDKPPELPEGWEVDRAPGHLRGDLRTRVSFPSGLRLYSWEEEPKVQYYLSHDLAALRQPDQEVRARAKEEDGMPEKPWQVNWIDSRNLIVVTGPSGSEHWYYFNESNGNAKGLRMLKHALEALRQDDGEVELMVTWNQVRDLIQENWTSGISHPVGADNFLSELRLLAVRARRVRS